MGLCLLVALDTAPKFFSRRAARSAFASASKWERGLQLSRAWLTVSRNTRRSVRACRFPYAPLEITIAPEPNVGLSLV